ncbi:hypothetical protein E8E13_009573 [Curvularia kusanoi]|uniref:Uncharacterized protein n=1 Tax=Curvularia kusanoi TaxID=90978 RepID=A0A9P4TKA7_CURKU|nr:hypothetical protein E8E13_009573 [Curvularia kusanoi]
MLRSAIVLVTCTGVALAQDGTIKFFWPHAGDYQTPAVTIQSANASATIFHAACPTLTAEDDCDWRGGVDYTIFNSSTYEATMTGSSYALTRTCVDEGQGSLGCFVEGNNIRGVYAANEYWENASTDTITATITSGAERLKVSQASSPSVSHLSPTNGADGAPSEVPATISTAHLPQATGAAATSRASNAATILVLFAGAAALLL